MRTTLTAWASPESIVDSGYGKISYAAWCALECDRLNRLQYDNDRRMRSLGAVCERQAREETRLRILRNWEGYIAIADGEFEAAQKRAKLKRNRVTAAATAAGV